MAVWGKVQWSPLLDQTNSRNLSAIVDMKIDQFPSYFQLFWPLRYRVDLHYPNHYCTNFVKLLAVFKNNIMEFEEGVNWLQ